MTQQSKMIYSGHKMRGDREEVEGRSGEESYLDEGRTDTKKKSAFLTRARQGYLAEQHHDGDFGGSNGAD